ncbi:hypothetical protein HZR84_12100 [Hyphobacterium sp. CCMP332]|nr:hypothetical protein HZR84_12100 [Hyphobacterium sp. CCMP332]
MNRIILIGNGFDLAHGLKTRYRDFINHYWEQLILRLKETPIGHPFENDELAIRQIPYRHLQNASITQLSKILEDFNSGLIIKNRFFWNILKKSHIELWVDIEQEFYNELNRVIDTRKKEAPIGSNVQKYTIGDLNSDFHNTILLLNEYLTKVESEYKLDNPRIKSQLNDHMFHPTELKNLSLDSIEKLSNQEFELLKDSLSSVRDNYENRIKIPGKKREIIDQIHHSHDPKNRLKTYMFSEQGKAHFDFNPNTTLLLNFNYTSTHLNYIKPNLNRLVEVRSPSVMPIQIHGSIYPNDDNPIIFGFGDELDEQYKRIEYLNDNKYLEFIKSIQYSNRNNYKRLLEFIESDFFHVLIMGHSCGISDRTLLNTIFEHDNCAFIKPYYYQWKNQNDQKVYNNYSDIVRNISRNFNSKAKMRDRLVNYEMCSPLIE